MSSIELHFGQVDLTSCDREPIHIPGSIQPHGVLLVVDLQTLTIAQFAGDASLLLGVAPERLQHGTLADLFDAPTLALLVKGLHAPFVKPSVLLGLSPREGVPPLHATVHAQGDMGLIELEPAVQSRQCHVLMQVQNLLSQLPEATTTQASCQAAAVMVREVSGFDRVMVYQFLHDGSGQVVAEAKAEWQHSFLDLHFPASDIPQQARALYLRNWSRLIPDVNYTPQPLQAVAPGRSSAALDMSYCALRSVSPIHLEYLRNMGVGASMSLSIVIGGKLWGLIACHHDTAHLVAADQRQACDLLAQIFSMQLQARLEVDVARRRVAPAHIQETLSRLLPPGDVATTLMGEDVPLLRLIACGGAAIMLGGELNCVGNTPPPEFIADLVVWLTAQDQPVLDTFELGAVFPPAQPYADCASGLLAVSLSHRKSDFVLWFRPEVVCTVAWAGDPHKPVESGPHGDRLTPRQSFAAWRAEVHEQSAPWDAVDIATAHAFRLWLLESVLRQMELARQEREAAFAHQNMLMAELDHRVKNTLANIQALVAQTRVGANSLEDFGLTLNRRIRAMAQAHRLLSASRWLGASVYSLVVEELAPFQAGKGGLLQLRGANVQLSPAAALSFTLVVHELTSNAAKYGALSTPEGSINIVWHHRSDGALEFNWQEHNGPPVTPPTRRGFGSVLIERSLRHEVQGSSRLDFDPHGVRCVITIPVTHLVGPH
jgi:light-regulated signal transduction histidine kinase (bacteriophytochrome)